MSQEQSYDVGNSRATIKSSYETANYARGGRSDVS